MVWTTLAAWWQRHCAIIIYMHRHKRSVSGGQFRNPRCGNYTVVTFWPPKSPPSHFRIAREVSHVTLATTFRCCLPQIRLGKQWENLVTWSLLWHCLSKFSGSVHASCFTMCKSCKSASMHSRPRLHASTYSTASSSAVGNVWGKKERMVNVANFVFFDVAPAALPRALA